MRNDTDNEVSLKSGVQSPFGAVTADSSEQELAKYIFALGRSEERYKLAIEGLSVAIWDWTIASNELFWSPRYAEIIRKKNIEEDYKQWEDRLHPEDKERTLTMLFGHLKNRTPYDAEYRLRRDDGEYAWIHGKGQAVWDENGNAIRMVGSIEDITWRKTAEEHLKDEAARLSAIMNTVLDGLITIDMSGNIQSFNPAAERIFGYRPEEVIGKNVKVLMPEPYQSEHDGYLKNYLTTGDRKVIGIGREVAARRKDGSVFPMELGINEMAMVGKRMFVGTIRDISERKKNELEIRKYLSSLKRSNQELDDFAYIASHDLKEPLRGLSNNAIFLKEDYCDKLDSDGVKRLERITYLCERMERLVNDLLYFSRLGRQELAIQKTNLNQVVADIASMMESTLLEQNAHIDIPSPLPTIVCDLPRITEVFRNLITNAVKYNDKPLKRVEVGWVVKRGEYAFYVKDNGIGIEKQFYDDVFRIFKRLNEEDDSVKGTGVGLTFVKKIIERHNGTIWIESEVGKGTTFYFTLNQPQEVV